MTAATAYHPVLASEAQHGEQHLAQLAEERGLREADARVVEYLRHDFCDVTDHHIPALDSDGMAALYRTLLAARERECPHAADLFLALSRVDADREALL